MKDAKDIAKEIDESYFDNYYGEGKEFSKDNLIWNTRRILNAVKPFVRKPKEKLSFVDLGAGKGALVERLREQGIDAYGYELNEYALSQRSYNMSYYVMERDVTDPFHQHFDIAYANVFPYFSDRDFNKFFTVNPMNFHVLVFPYPYDEETNDKYRQNWLDRDDFKEYAKKYDLMMYQVNNAFNIMIKREDLDKIPFEE